MEHPLHLDSASIMELPSFPDLIGRLEQAFGGSLPGRQAHRVMAPDPERRWPADFDPQRIRQAAGLVLLFPIDERAHLVLTVRAAALGRHGGQVALPGGVIEPGETPATAALREAQEEIGLRSDEARVLGALTPLDIPVSGFRLYPIVAAALSRPALARRDSEVARILEPALDELLDPTRLGSVERIDGGRLRLVPHFRIAGEHVWGATAMILAELLALLGWPGASVQRP